MREVNRANILSRSGPVGSWWRHECVLGEPVREGLALRRRLGPFRRKGSYAVAECGSIVGTISWILKYAPGGGILV